MSARDRLRDHFERNVGKKLTAKQLAKVAGISEWARRVRELRDDEGMRIVTGKDRDDLKHHEYVLETLERRPRFSHGISNKLRVEVLARNGFTCRYCGAGPDEPDRRDPARKTTLQVHHLDPDGPSTLENLVTTCAACNQGMSNLGIKPSTINLKAAVRKASREEQLELLNWLRTKFPGD